jgi:hypothetical protein
MYRLILVTLTVLASMNTYSQSIPLSSLKDSAHINNVEIQKQKEVILKQIESFNDWFNSSNHYISYIRRKSKWYKAEGVHEWREVISNDDRLKIITDSILPDVEQCSLITENFKTKVLENHSKYEDPGNLSFLMAEVEEAKGVINLLIDHVNGFYRYLGLGHLLSGDEPGYEPKLPKITKDDEKKYYYEMIRIKGDKAIFVLNRESVMPDTPMSYEDYFVISLVNDSEKGWLVNNLQILKEGEFVINK